MNFGLSQSPRVKLSRERQMLDLESLFNLSYGMCIGRARSQKDEKVQVSYVRIYLRPGCG